MIFGIFSKLNQKYQRELTLLWLIPTASLLTHGALQMFELLFVSSAKPAMTKLEEAPLTVGASLAPQVLTSKLSGRRRKGLTSNYFSCRIVDLLVETAAVATSRERIPLDFGKDSDDWNIVNFFDDILPPFACGQRSSILINWIRPAT